MCYNINREQKEEGAFRMLLAQKYRAIVAHGDPAEQQRISRILEETKLFQVICTTHSGEECIRRTLHSQPDLVIADTLLSGVDGLEVLQQIKLRCSDTRVLLLTGYNMLACHRAVLEMADYCIVTPYAPDILTSRAIELVQTQQKDTFAAHLVSNETAAELAILCAPVRLKGYPYISDGIQLSVHDPDVIHHHIGPNGLYAQLCRRHNETYRNIERCMRSVSDHIFKYASLDVLEQYFTQADLARGRITNITLISTLAARISNNLREQQRCSLS